MRNTTLTILTIVAVILFIVHLKGWISDRFLNRIVSIATIVAAVSALMVFFIPAAQEPKPITPPETPKISPQQSSNLDSKEMQIEERKPQQTPITKKVDVPADNPLEMPTKAPPAKVTVIATAQGFKEPIAGIEFVKVLGGCFQMGNIFKEPEKAGYINYVSDNALQFYDSEDELPVHEVCVSDFAIGKFEVTQGQWKSVMGNNPSEFLACGSKCPAENISWNDAQQFIQRLNKKSGNKFRLPTEAEWEYACRSGGMSEKFCGGNDLNEVAWHEGNSNNRTHPVGQKKPNGLGIYDMSGNVFEWVSDWRGDYPSSQQQDPIGPLSGEVHVTRGGSFMGTDSGDPRAASRTSDSTDHRHEFSGFRLATPLH